MIESSPVESAFHTIQEITRLKIISGLNAANELGEAAIEIIAGNVQVPACPCPAEIAADISPDQLYGAPEAPGGGVLTAMSAACAGMLTSGVIRATLPRTKPFICFNYGAFWSTSAAARTGRKAAPAIARMSAKRSSQPACCRYRTRHNPLGSSSPACRQRERYIQSADRRRSRGI